jgi:hypothetical protein
MNYGVVVGYGVIEKLTSRLTSHVVFALRTNSGAHLMVSSVVLIYVRLCSHLSTFAVPAWSATNQICGIATAAASHWKLF